MRRVRKQGHRPSQKGLAEDTHTHTCTHTCTYVLTGHTRNLPTPRCMPSYTHVCEPVDTGTHITHLQTPSWKDFFRKKMLAGQ